MKPQVFLCTLAIILGAAPAAPAFGEIVTCSDSAHVSWRADDSFTLIHGAVVRVPGCDNGEAVGLQVLTTDGDVPNEPLRASADDENATFDLEPYGLRIEPVIGVRVFLNGRPVAVQENENDDGPSGVDDDGDESSEGDDGDGPSEGETDGDTGGTPPPAGGVGGVRTERPAPPPAVGGGDGDRPDAQPAPAPSDKREGGSFALATTGTSVATMLALAVAALLVGGLLRRYRRRET